MKQYTRPTAVAVTDTGEGVFAASGSAAADSQITGAVTGAVSSYDHYGNYYLTFTGFENAAVYTITITVKETNTVYGLQDASWTGFGAQLTGNVVTFTNVTFANQNEQHIRLYFESQGNWEYGWQLSDSDIPSLKIQVTKVS